MTAKKKKKTEKKGKNISRKKALDAAFPALSKSPDESFYCTWSDGGVGSVLKQKYTESKDYPPPPEFHYGQKVTLSDPFFRGVVCTVTNYYRVSGGYEYSLRSGGWRVLEADLQPWYPWYRRVFQWVRSRF